MRSSRWKTKSDASVAATADPVATTAASLASGRRRMAATSIRKPPVGSASRASATIAVAATCTTAITITSSPIPSARIGTTIGGTITATTTVTATTDHGDRHGNHGDGWWGNDLPFCLGWWGGSRNLGWNFFWGDRCWRNNPWYWWGGCSAPLLTTWVDFGWNYPCYWDYGPGEYITYYNNTVYVDNQRYATELDYYAQVRNLARSVPPLTQAQLAGIEWLPLGVFAVTRPGQAQANELVQLAVSKDGILSGTLLNQQTGQARPLQGMVEQATQKAAWTFADSPTDALVDRDQPVQPHRAGMHGAGTPRRGEHRSLATGAAATAAATSRCTRAGRRGRRSGTGGSTGAAAARRGEIATTGRSMYFEAGTPFHVACPLSLFYSHNMQPAVEHVGQGLLRPCRGPRSDGSAC